MMKRRCLLFVVLSELLLNVVFIQAAFSKDVKFNHPGLLHSKESLIRIKHLVTSGNPVAKGSYLKLAADAKASSDYKMSGPFPIIARDGEYAKTKKPCEDDFLAAYYNSLLYHITGKESYAVKAMEIIRAYASVLDSIGGHDAPLCAGLQGFIFVNACEMLRYGYPRWTTNDTKATESILKRAFLPVLDEFDRRSPYANGNWGAAVNKMRMAIGVYCDDSAQYDQAVAYYRASGDNGSLPNYIAESGQCQESGRDQAHVMLGLGLMAEICEMAWSQGDDLYGELDNRLLKGYEYTSRANLGYDVPFFTWKDKTGRYCNWTVLSEQALGQWRAVFEIAYNHYVGRRHIEMPYTSKAIGHYIRPEGAGFTCDNPGFGSLLFYQYTDADADSSVPEPLQYKINTSRPYSAEEEPVIRMENAPNLTLGRHVDCWMEYWDLKPVRVIGNIYEYEPSGSKSRNGLSFSEKQQNTTFLVRNTGPQ